MMGVREENGSKLLLKLLWISRRGCSSLVGIVPNKRYFETQKDMTNHFITTSVQVLMSLNMQTSVSIIFSFRSINHLFVFCIIFHFQAYKYYKARQVGMEQPITLTIRGKIAIITLNIEKKLNALTQDLYYRLSCLMREVAAREDIYITILTGKGRYFSA